MKIKLKAQIVREYIAKNNLSYRKFAHILGYDSGQLSNWINGTRTIGWRAREIMQKKMKLSWDELFFIEEELGGGVE